MEYPQILRGIDNPLTRPGVAGHSCAERPQRLLGTNNPISGRGVSGRLLREASSDFSLEQGFSVEVVVCRMACCLSDGLM